MSDVRTPPSMPHCFDSLEQWQAWYQAAIVCARLGYDYDEHGNPKPVNYCTDCTAEHQQRMLSQGRCAWPGVRFVDIEGVPHGRRPK